MNTKHTPGPWRWEINEKSKIVRLCGGRPKYDLTVMDFVRWGMGGATPRFRNASDHGLLERCIVWAKAVIGRSHHAHWFKALDHPDARLIAASPELLEALQACEIELTIMEDMYPNACSKRESALASARAAIAKATGEA